jgi:dephospho-CoA kinase
MKSLKVGITGGIGSGKSTVCKIFALLGVPVYDADSQAKRLMIEDEVLVAQIKAEFGEQSYAKNGELNREYLSREVFNNSLKLESLNRLVHPRVGLDSERWLNENANAPYTIKEAALLFEAGSYRKLDKIIVVVAPEAIRVSRVVNRDKSRTQADVLKIMGNQMPEEEKISRADFVINNDENELLIPQVLKLHERFINGLDN